MGAILVDPENKGVSVGIEQKACLFKSEYVYHVYIRVNFQFVTNRYIDSVIFVERYPSVVFF